MKTKLLIIEDNICKFFTTKQVLEAQLRVSVNAIDSSDTQHLFEIATDLDPDTILFCPHGGVIDLLENMKKRGVNRRNTEITLLHFQETDSHRYAKIQAAFDGSTVARAA
jgi:hypothetical protein